MVNIQIIVGSTRKGRYSDKPAQWIYTELLAVPEVKAEIVDLRDYDLPFFNEAVSPSRLNKQYSQPEIIKWSAKVDQADAFIIISPEYNHGYTAVLKNALDHLYSEWGHKPVGFISYGGVSGARVIEQIRLVSIELQMLPIKNAIHIPMDVYVNTMKLEAPVDAQLFNSALRKPSHDITKLFFDELIQLSEVTKGLRIK